MKLKSLKWMASILSAATVLFALTPPIVWAEGDGASGTGTAPAHMSTYWIGGSILFLMIVVLLFGAYMFFLQRQFLNACRESNQLPLFFNKPAGLPEGTIRSILTLLVIIFSLYLFILQAGGVGVFPEALSAILSAIVGFYFGHRSMSGKDDKMIEHLKSQLDDASANKDQSRAQQVVDKIGKNIQLLKTVMDVLPAETQKKYEPLLDKLQKGSAAAGALLDSGAFSQAAEKAQSLYEAFKQENPLKAIVQKASLSFAAVAGGVPPLAIIAAIVGVSATAAGVAYSRWKARLLNTPLSPSVAPLKMVDTDTCFATMLGIPALKTAFKDKLEQRDGAFLEQLMSDFLRKEDDALWPVYGQPYGFDSLEDFQEAVQAFRMALAGREIETEAAPAVFAETGGYQSFMKAIDRIRADKTAGADLDRLMEVVDGVKKTDEPLAAIFEKVRKEVEKS
jgi:hypothetical protein